MQFKWIKQATVNTNMGKIRVGNACGFWGDDLHAPAQLAAHGHLDYLTLEYLAELTMSILAHQKAKDPSAGFASDFLEVLGTLIPHMQGKPNLKVITNAGGMNPVSCCKKAQEVLLKAGLKKRLGYLTGDNLLPLLPDLLREGIPFENMEDGRPLETILAKVVSANAYLGSEGIIKLLNQGVDIVITGRVADACLTVGPAAHFFKTPLDDWNSLAGFTVAGHLIECGAQVSGGNFTHWNKVPSFETIGYPIAEINEDGSFILTKPEGTGGLVNFETVAEQLLYEVGNPEEYLTPDVRADFTSVKINDLGSNKAEVGRANGRMRPNSLKVSIAYRDGFMASGTLLLAGKNANKKAECCADIIQKKLKQSNAMPESFHAEILGAGGSLPGVLPQGEPYEAVLRVAAKDGNKEKIELFSRELAPLVTSGPQGVTGYTGGRPQVREVFRYWPALIPRDRVSIQLGLL